MGPDHVHAAPVHQDGALGAPGQRGQLAVPAHVRQRRVEVAHLVERADLELVREEDVDVVLDQVEEGGAVPLHAERVGEGERHLASRLVRDRGRGAEGLLRLGGIEEVTLEVEDPAARDQARVHVRRPEPHRRSEEGAHGALGVRGHQDEAASGGGPAGGPRGVVADAGRPQVVAEDLPELIVAHLADVVRAASEGGHSHHGVGRRAARHLDPGAHGLVERAGPGLVHQVHRPLHETLPRDLVLVGLAQHVDQGVADADHVQLGLSHGGAPAAWAGSSDRGAGPGSCACAGGTASGW